MNKSETRHIPVGISGERHFVSQVERGVRQAHPRRAALRVLPDDGSARAGASGTSSSCPRTATRARSRRRTSATRPACSRSPAARRAAAAASGAATTTPRASSMATAGATTRRRRAARALARGRRGADVDGVEGGVPLRHREIRVLRGGQERLSTSRARTASRCRRGRARAARRPPAPRALSGFAPEIRLRLVRQQGCWRRGRPGRAPARDTGPISRLGFSAQLDVPGLP